MLKKPAYVLAGILLFSLSLFLLFIVAYLVSTEVVPAMEHDSLSVKSNVMILNILWEGNEIYILLTAYTLLAGAFGWIAIRILENAKNV